MSIFTGIPKQLGKMWLKREVDRGRKEGWPVTKLLDGNKRTIFILGFILSGLTSFLTGYDVSQWIDLGLQSMGWTDPVAIGEAKGIATQAVPLLLALWAAISNLRKMWQQYQAGAKLSELNKPIGVLKAAVADGTLGVVALQPVVLSVEGKAIVAPSISAERSTVKA